ncbi:MAG: DUF58 domain-containing protein [Planctomycetes bacterium]|nr:DUF58 domain-containing protein [Planctomycetota bacterium]
MAEQVNYLDPKVLNKISNLELRARNIVEGFISGLHKSPYHGFSVEFAEHREYVPGDDLRHLDWRALAKSDRYYIKQYEEETNLRCTFIVDTSESMYFGGEQTLSKIEYAISATAAMGFLLTDQADAIGLATINHRLDQIIPPKSSKPHLRKMMLSLAGMREKPRASRKVKQLEVREDGKTWHEAIPAKARERKAGDTGTKVSARKDIEFGEDVLSSLTDIRFSLHEISENLSRRGMVVLLSDLFDRPKRIVEGLRWITKKQNDVIVFHIMDDAELTFPFHQLTMFDGLEQYPELLIEPRALRNAYLEEIDEFTKKMKGLCLSNGIDYQLLNTNMDLGVALNRFLAARARRRKGT